MAENIKKNYFYNLLYQMTAILLPLITMPYVSRKLGATAVSINSITYNNIQYFILLGSLGIGTYGTKRIATIRESKGRLQSTFWEIFLIQFLGCMFTYTVYLLIFSQSVSYSRYYILQGFFLLATSIDVSWYFLGIENFKKASIRSLIVKISAVVLIFIFVKSPDDLGKYIFINSFTMFLGQIVMWLYIDKDVVRIPNMGKLNLIKHIIPVLALFIPQIATQVYTVLDKTMLQVLSTSIETVGYYDYSQKIIRILLAAVTSLGTVMLPKIANLYSKNEIDGVKAYLKKAFMVSTLLSVPMAFGLMAVSDRFIPMFFTKEFLPSVTLTEISSVLIIIIGLGNVFGSQFLLATGRNKEYTMSVTAAAIVNLILNLILIPRLDAVGAVISTVIAEFIGAMVQFYYSRSVFDFTWIKATYKYWISGVVMFIVVRNIGNIEGARLAILSKQVFVGIGVYFGGLLILKDSFSIDTIKGIIERVILLIKK